MPSELGPKIDVSRIEPLSALRAHPKWYFKSGRFERETMSSLLVREALLSTVVTRAWAAKDRSWTAVIADGDWLASDLSSFSAPTAFPEGGVNSMRVEVLLTAFCDTVVTSANGRRDDIETAGLRDMPDSMEASLESGGGRVIVFRSPPDELTAGTVTPASNDIFPKSSVGNALRRIEEYASA